MYILLVHAASGVWAGLPVTYTTVFVYQVYKYQQSFTPCELFRLRLPRSTESVRYRDGVAPHFHLLL